MLYINVGADALIGPIAGLFGEQALQYGLTEYLLFFDSAAGGSYIKKVLQEIVNF